MLSQTITVPTVGSSNGFTATQVYEYDELNRLKGAVETEGTSQTNWEQHFRYDRYGNRTVITDENKQGQEAVTTESVVGLNPDVSTSTNRIVPKQNTTEQYQFDASGNMTRDDVGNTFTFDAENHQKTYTPIDTQLPSATYFYDGDGKRVKKVVGNEVTIFVYDGGGALVAEYTQNITASTNPQTVYLTADALGTPRINTNQKGEVVARHDYLPFGDEINIVFGQQTMGSRYGHSEYVPDDMRQKFTGYEKDEETGLDFAKARYYGNGLGRFTSLDPLLSSARVGIPQSWNRYSYCINNPIRFTDPTGMDWYLQYIREGGRRYRDPVWYNEAPAGTKRWNGGDIHRAINTTTGEKVWQVLNPWENEKDSFATKEEAIAQFNTYKQQAAFDRFAGTISGFYTSADLALMVAENFGVKVGSVKIRTDSEQFKLGQKVGNMMSYVAIVAGGVGITAVVAGKLLGNISRIISKYPATSGYCNRAAQQILSAFEKAGVKGEIVNLVDSGGASFLKNAAGENLSTTGWHQVVRVGDRYYDALTGPNGATWEEYLKLWHKDTASNLVIRQ